MKKVMLLASEDMCDILQQELNNKYIILPCSDLAAAEKLLALEPDVLILSLSLPAGNGLTFLKTHVENLPAFILAITAYIDDTLLDELHTVGICSVVRIPFHPLYLQMNLSDL